MQNNDEEDKDVHHWHLDKRLSVSHIITTLSAIFMFGVFMARQDTRLSLSEQAMMYIAHDQKRQDEELKAVKVAFEAQFGAINLKLDRIIEHQRLK
jgi:hypothetical protein